MSPGMTESPATRLRQAVEAARDAAERATRVRHETAAELERAVQRMELGAPGARGVETALSAQLARLADALSHPPRRWVRVGESRVHAAAETLAGQLSRLATVEAGVGAAAGEQLRNRQELRRSFRRIPDLGHAAEQGRRHLERAFQRRTVAAAVGRLAASGRVLTRLASGRAGLEELAVNLATLLTPLGRLHEELGFFTCRGRAAAIPATVGRRQEDVVLQVAPDGELMLSWDRHGTPRIYVYPARETAWRDGKTRWRPCFSLPRGEADGRRLRVERPALATWTGDGRARLVRAGALAWEERTHPHARAGARKPASREEG